MSLVSALARLVSCAGLGLTVTACSSGGIPCPAVVVQPVWMEYPANGATAVPDDPALIVAVLGNPRVVELAVSGGVGPPSIAAFPTALPNPEPPIAAPPFTPDSTFAVAVPTLSPHTTYNVSTSTLSVGGCSRDQIVQASLGSFTTQ